MVMFAGRPRPPASLKNEFFNSILRSAHVFERNEELVRLATWRGAFVCRSGVAMARGVAGRLTARGGSCGGVCSCRTRTFRLFASSAPLPLLDDVIGYSYLARRRRRFVAAMRVRTCANFRVRSSRLAGAKRFLATNFRGGLPLQLVSEPRERSPRCRALQRR